MLKHSELFARSFHIVCSNKHIYDFDIDQCRTDNKIILVPFEFLCDFCLVWRIFKGILAKWI